MNGLRPLAVLWATLATAAAAEPPQAAAWLHDFDGDGIEERLVSGPGVTEIQRRHPTTQAWEKADFTLPEGVVQLDADGRDAGLRFVDLNGDGFDDVLFSNGKRYAIYLWTKNVQPQLGWAKGWSQFVHAGERSGANNEPPSLVGATVRVENGDLVITPPTQGTAPARAMRVSARALIAFDMPPPKSPDEALASLRVRPGFRVELAAAEPVVIDPIAFDWGADGRLWVVEMRDYPLGLDGHGRPGGVIKILEDTDGDGRYDRAIPFLEGVPFPSSVMPWRRGALVAAAPDLFYAEDTDGDGRADVRQVLFTGFNPGNQQHRLNGFEWGLDGWVYAANGDSGGKVKSLATGQVLSISGRDVRFRPDTGEIETVSAQTQFGRRRDDWGRWFGNNNPTWLWHVTVPEHYLRRNPQLAVKSVLRVLANYPDSTRVFPVSAPMVRPNQPWSLNHVTSGCSPCPYRDDWFGPDFATTVFASEPVHNVVHREVLEPEGAGLRSHRAAGEEESEFLASTDNWFRPVTLKTGPDGALYVADMYRFVIEHPEWISPEMQARLDLRAGDDRGRLYRVVPEGQRRRAIPNLAKLSANELVQALDSPNGWQRDTAMRLLVERSQRPDPTLLEDLLTVTHAPQVRLQALATLALLGRLTAATVASGLADPHPAVRCEALRQSEAFVNAGDALFRGVATLATDSDPAVRLQAAFSLGAWPASLSEPVLRDLASRDDADELLRTAVMSSLSPESGLFAQLRTHSPPPKPAAVSVAVKPTSDDRAAVIARYRAVGQLTGDPVRGQPHFQTLCTPCHRLHGEGNEVGPDLGMASTKPVEWLVTAILDPSQAVEPRYRAWNVATKSGDEFSGLVSAETANNVVVRVAGGGEHAILPTDLVEMAPSAVSLMPDGFESALTPQDLADLLAWLRTP